MPHKYLVFRGLKFSAMLPIHWIQAISTKVSEAKEKFSEAKKKVWKWLVGKEIKALAEVLVVELILRRRCPDHHRCLRGFRQD